MDKNYVALIPAYKPGDYLLDLTVKLKGKGFSVVIVDDGSGADYADFFLASTCFAEVLHHSENMGKGRALKTGINAISRYCTSDTVIVTVDAE